MTFTKYKEVLHEFKWYINWNLIYILVHFNLSKINLLILKKLREFKISENLNLLSWTISIVWLL